MRIQFVNCTQGTKVSITLWAPLSIEQGARTTISFMLMSNITSNSATCTVDRTRFCVYFEPTWRTARGRCRQAKNHWSLQRKANAAQASHMHHWMRWSKNACKFHSKRHGAGKVVFKMSRSKELVQKEFFSPRFPVVHNALAAHLWTACLVCDNPECSEGIKRIAVPGAITCAAAAACTLCYMVAPPPPHVARCQSLASCHDLGGSHIEKVLQLLIWMTEVGVAGSQMLLYKSYYNTQNQSVKKSLFSSGLSELRSLPLLLLVVSIPKSAELSSTLPCMQWLWVSSVVLSNF
jgi:hypothetical protein